MTLADSAARNAKALTDKWFGDPTLPTVVLGMVLASLFPTTRGKLVAFAIALAIYLAGDRINRVADAWIESAAETAGEGAPDG